MLHSDAPQGVSKKDFMPIASNLVRRGGAYAARLRVPADLVERVGRRELTKGLGTSDPHEAKRKVRIIVDGWLRQFDELRRQKMVAYEDTAAAPSMHYDAALLQDDQARARIPSEADLEASIERATLEAQRTRLDPKNALGILDVSLEAIVIADARKGSASVAAKSRRTRRDILREHLSKGETVLVEHETKAYLSRNNLIALHGSKERNALSLGILRAEIEALERAIERDQGNYAGEPRDSIVKAKGAPRISPAPDGETILEIFAIYRSENPRGVKPDTLNQARRDIGWFVDLVGDQMPVTAITKKSVREFKALLTKFPVKGSEITAFAGMNFPQIVAANENVGKPTLTNRTINRYLASVSAFCRWLVSNGYLDVNPVEGMSLAKGDENGGVPYTTDQLNSLFRSSLFTGCQPLDVWSNMAKPGPVLIRDYRFWVPLIMLFSGARPGEIAQLNVNDLKQEHGHWIMHIMTDGRDGKSVKTRGSMRVLPLHSELILLGLIDYHAKMKAAGEIRLFPNAERTARGQMIGAFSREFSKYLERIGMKEGRGLSLYSFRHGVADAFRRAGYLDDQFGFMLGHGKASMTGRYGNLPQGIIEQRVELINAIAYPGLSLDHLRPQ
jgi:integrase